MFNDYMRKCGLKACMYVSQLHSHSTVPFSNFYVPNSSVSVSGGVDSAVTLGLMKYAMSMSDSPIKKILGIAQPIKSSQWALDRALECGKNMDVEIMIVDQTDIYNQLVCSQSRLSHQS